ncbi:MAG TPA: hypothetical protein VN628_19880 [Vicinamibacterales bacterium]|nr:hypothetical protein [Vicinamibacterales bacterium]
MLKGTREGLVKKLQPVSIHGQMSVDVYFTDPADPDGQVSVARVGNEAVDSTIEPGDTIKLEYLVGQVVKVTRIVPVA